LEQRGIELKFLIAFGTRPEWIKLKPVIDMFNEKNISYKTLFSGQHVDLLPKEVIDSVDLKLKINDGPNRLDSIVGSVMVDAGIWDEDITHVMIQGDTTSAFAIALAGFHRKLKVVHLEAGLRTYNIWDPYPEEFNRQAISRLTDLHLCPTDLSKQYLDNERVSGKIVVVGNTVLDNLRDVTTEYTNKVVVTMHRRENHEIIDQWFTEIDKIAEANKDLEFIIPLHPNPNVQKHKHLLKNLKIVEPMEYNEFIKLLAQTRLVISDSGGLQEETSFLKKKCIVCRKTTERLEGVDTFAFMCLEPKELEAIFNQVNADYIPVGDCPYGDGYAAQKVYEVLKDEDRGRF
jgi:UDP-N-acetylglucosamine 2-epimerase (non-hydrolysing)